MQANSHGNPIPPHGPDDRPGQAPMPRPRPDEVPADDPPETPPDAPVEIPPDAAPDTLSGVSPRINANAASNGYWVRDGIGPKRYVPPPGTVRSPGPNGLGVKAAFGPAAEPPDAPGASISDGADTGPTPGTVPDRSATPRPPPSQGRDHPQHRTPPMRSSPMKRNALWAGAGMAGLAVAYAMLRKRRDATAHPADSAPSRASRQSFGPDKAVSAAVTIRASSAEVIDVLASDSSLASAMAGTPGAPMNPIEHGPDSDVWSWRNESGETLVKLRIRPVRDGSLTAVTGIVAHEGSRVQAALASMKGTGPLALLRQALVEARMRIETGQIAVAVAPAQSRKG